MGNSDAMSTIVAQISKNQAMVDGVINAAVQDSTMRMHVMNVLKGMQAQMAAAAKKK
jgi:hypothetical protein